MLAAIFGGGLFLGEAVVVAVVTDVGYGPVLLTLLSVPALADLYSSPGSLANKAQQLLRMFW